MPRIPRKILACLGLFAAACAGVFPASENITVPRSVVAADAPELDAEAGPIDIVLYNTYGGRRPGGGRNDAQTQAELKEISADLTCLNEVDQRYKPLTQASDHDNGSIFVPTNVIPGSNKIVGNAVLSPYSMELEKVIDLSTNFMDTYRKWESRKLMDVKIHKTDGTNLRVLNTHLSRNELDRKSQVGLITDYIHEIQAEGSDDIVFCGDLNMTAEELAGSRLAEVFDLSWLAENQLKYTYAFNKKDAKGNDIEPGQRIDFVLVYTAKAACRLFGQNAEDEEVRNGGSDHGMLLVLGTWLDNCEVPEIIAIAPEVPMGREFTTAA